MSKNKEIEKIQKDKEIEKIQKDNAVPGGTYQSGSGWLIARDSRHPLTDRRAPIRLMRQ